MGGAVAQALVLLPLHLEVLLLDDEVLAPLDVETGVECVGIGVLLVAPAVSVWR
jgi:hypothetical protein